LLEIPVTTIPVLKLPFHFSYIIWLAERSPSLARMWFGLALRLCRMAGIGPSLLLHPLDFLGPENGHDELSFFPGMRTSAQAKAELLDQLIAEFAATFEVTPLHDHAEALTSMAPATEHDAMSRPAE
jgi:hypothetical protein